MTFPTFIMISPGVLIYHDIHIYHDSPSVLMTYPTVLNIPRCTAYPLCTAQTLCRVSLSGDGVASKVTCRLQRVTCPRCNLSYLGLERLHRVNRCHTVHFSLQLVLIKKSIGSCRSHVTGFNLKLQPAMV